jgi:hypothetical protein
MESPLAFLVTSIGNEECGESGEDVGRRDEEEGAHFGVVEGGDEGGDEGCNGTGGGFGYDYQAGVFVLVPMLHT